MSEPELETFQCFQCGLKVHRNGWPEGWKLFEFEVKLKVNLDEDEENFSAGLCNNFCLCSEECIQKCLSSGSQRLGILEPWTAKTIFPPVEPFKELLEAYLERIEGTERVKLLESED
jgi:hypothetical protein